MKSQQLFEIDRKICQIQRTIQLRQQRADEWEPNIKYILKQKTNKQSYLSKKYNHQMQNQQIFQSKDIQVTNLKLQASESRKKIMNFRNQLKELDDLVKKRNKIKLLNNQKQNEELKKKREKQFNQTNIHDFGKKNFQVERKRQTIPFIRHERQKGNPFQSMKGDKLLEIHQQAKNKSNSVEQYGVQLKKSLGVGLQFTPFYSFLKEKSNETNNSFLKTKEDKKIKHKQNIKLKTCSSLKKKFNNKKIIYLNNRSQESIKFQNRLKNIIRYHSKNIEQLTFGRNV